jgi:hypothetical protein
VPRYRAQRIAVNAARRVQLLAAKRTAAKTAAAASRLSEWENADATLPFSALRVRALRARLLGNGRLATDPGLVAGAARGLLATPWFAAATGFVVAAGLWIYSPHAELEFPPGAGGVVHCGLQGCRATAGQNGDAPASTGQQAIGQTGATTATTHAQRARPSAVAGLKFSYSVLGQQDGRFFVAITITGRHVPRTWRLRFALPSDQISAVYYATWRPSGTDGGTASGPYAAVSRQYQWPGDSGSSDAGTVFLGSNRHEIGFMVVGEGTPVMPDVCSFDGSTCSFS